MNNEQEAFRIKMMDQKLTEMDEECYAGHIGAHIMTVSEFLHDVKWNYLTPYDGSARIRGGAQDNEHWDWETPIPSDATHIEWYNK